MADWPRAQALMDRLVTLPWAELLNRWAQAVNPGLAARARPRLRSYYWTVRQGEYARAGMFRRPQALAEVYPALCRHALEQFSSPQGLRFLGRRTNPRFNGEICSPYPRRGEGVCVKHRVEENSIKRYDKQGSLLRVETTLNHPSRFRVDRGVRRKGRKVKGWYPLRKGIVDLRRRVQLSRGANARDWQALAVVGDSQPAHRLLDPVSQPVKTPRRYRALQPIPPNRAVCLPPSCAENFTGKGSATATCGPPSPRRRKPIPASAAALLPTSLANSACCAPIDLSTASDEPTITVPRRKANSS